MFQHTAARRRLDSPFIPLLVQPIGFNTQPPEGGWQLERRLVSRRHLVSTHSRPKAAGFDVGFIAAVRSFQHTAARRRLAKLAGEPIGLVCFNTQPPEGGWRDQTNKAKAVIEFQHTAARRRLGDDLPDGLNHIRRFNTQPPEGGWRRWPSRYWLLRCFNTQPPEGGWRRNSPMRNQIMTFQHTAARRRLEKYYSSTDIYIKGFNTQPPEGGWSYFRKYNSIHFCFNTQPPEGGWTVSMTKLLKH